VAPCGAQFEPKNGDNFFQKSSINLRYVMLMRNVILQSNLTFNWILKKLKLMIFVEKWLDAARRRQSGKLDHNATALMPIIRKMGEKRWQGEKRDAVSQGGTSGKKVVTWRPCGWRLNGYNGRPFSLPSRWP
jgi:hypothetical protein